MEFLRVGRVAGVWALALALACAVTSFSAERAFAVVGVQGVLSASAGVTDNVDSSPNEPLPGTRGRRTDMLFVLTPGLVLTANTGRIVQRLGYTFSATLYARSSDANTYQNAVAWDAYILTSKRSGLGLAFRLSQGRQAAFNGAFDANNPTVQLRPASIINILSLGAQENFLHEFTARWRLLQSAGFSTTWLLDQSPPLQQNQFYSGSIGTDYSFPRDAIGVFLNLGYSRFLEQRGPTIDGTGAVDPDGLISPQRHELTLTPLARWRRDLTYFLAIRADLGAIVILDAERPRTFLAEPAGGLGFNFSSRLVSLDIAYAHGGNPNLLFRSFSLLDSVAVLLSAQLGERSGFRLQVGGSYGYGRQVDPDATITSRSHSATAAATISYAPFKFLNIFLSYQVNAQFGYLEDTVPVPSTYRNTALLGLNAIYPVELPVEIPRGSAGVRVDGRDGPGIRSSRSSSR